MRNSLSFLGASEPSCTNDIFMGPLSAEYCAKYIIWILISSLHFYKLGAINTSISQIRKPRCTEWVTYLPKATQLVSCRCWKQHLVWDRQQEFVLSHINHRDYMLFPFLKVLELRLSRRPPPSFFLLVAKA